MELTLTYHGHSCVQLSGPNFSLIVDPFLAPNNPLAVHTADEIEVQYILLTHGHSDHIADALEIAKKNNATIIATFELATYMGWQGANAHTMNLGGSYSFPFGQVTMTHAFHSSAFTEDENKQITYLGMPGGFLITIDGYTIYHLGDTGLFSDLKLIGERNDIDLALIPIGDNFTMGPKDALTAAEWLRAKSVIPIHYNTFPLIEQDGEAFASHLAQRSINGQALVPGESIHINTPSS